MRLKTSVMNSGVTANGNHGELACLRKFSNDPHLASRAATPARFRIATSGTSRSISTCVSKPAPGRLEAIEAQIRDEQSESERLRRKMGAIGQAGMLIKAGFVRGSFSPTGPGKFYRSLP
jgi:hypothetical protein